MTPLLNPSPPAEESAPLQEVTNRRILIVDDNPAIHDDFRKVLSEVVECNSELLQAETALFGAQPETAARPRLELDSAFQGEEALQKVRNAVAIGAPYAMAFLDIRMPPGWDGVQTATKLWEADPALQIVICTAYSDYSWDEMIARLGSHGNLVILKKPFDNVEVLQLAHAFIAKWDANRKARLKHEELEAMVAERTRALEQTNRELSREIEERRRVEEYLSHSEERFAQAFNASPIPLSIEAVSNQEYLDVNQAFLDLTGYTREEVIGHTATELQVWAEPETQQQLIWSAEKQQPLRNLECTFRTRQGESRQALVSTELVKIGSKPYLLMLAEDLSERVQLERQFRQAQKMEAIGQLAAGVAHDFNNILTVIHGHASMLLMRLGTDGPHAKSVLEIRNAAERATNLVRQLLAFSRKQIMQFRNVDLGDVVRSISGMLEQLVGECVVLETECNVGLPAIFADRGMVEQVLLNLAVNARDAMPRGGRILVRAFKVTVDHTRAKVNPEAKPGDFVALAVGDNGCGIDPQVLGHLFEPFFTTKEVGKGTGLGLATVYGIVKQHQGWIDVETREGEGSTFTIYFPVSTHAAPCLTHSTEELLNRRGTECILIAEDETALREMISEILKLQGYRVLAANSGPAALELWNREKRRVDLLLTDLVMPGGMLGTELATELRRSNPGIKLIYTTGYSPGAAGSADPLREGINFLPKPYSPNKLVQIVRNALDSAA